MTSSHRRKRAFPLRRIAVIVGGLAVFAVIALFWLRPAGFSSAGPDAVPRSLALLKDGNATAARALANAAVQNAPDDGQAHVALAMAMLALDDGIGADAELKRAADSGYDAKLLPHLRAHALLLLNNPNAAIAEAEKTDLRFRPYGLRVRARAMTALGNLPAALESLDEAVRIAPQDADVWSDMGRFRFIAGDLLGAAQASERAVTLAPANFEALLLRGEIVRNQYGLVASLPWFEAALKQDPADHGALVEYAATLGDAGHTVDALAVTRRALAVRTGSPQALYLQAVIAARAGEYDLARTILGKTGGAVAGMPGAQLLGGSIDIAHGDYEQAIEKLSALVGQQPMNISARKLLAVALLRTDSARNAIDIMRPVVARADADSYSLTLVARGFERIGDRNAAAQFLDRAAYPATGATTSFSADDTPSVLAAAAAQRPSDPNVIVPLIRALIDSGNSPAALARANEIAWFNPGAPAAQIVLGDMLMLANRPADAIAPYRKAADLRFDEPTMLRLVESLERAKRGEEAANVLALFLSQNPTNLAALRLSAHWQLVAGEYDAAIDSLEDIRNRIGDGDAALNADLAAAYTAAGEPDTAQELGEAAYALAPTNPLVADAYGWAMFRAGDPTGALELLQKAVRLAPRHSGLNWHLAQVYAELNRKPEAKQAALAALADAGFGDREAAQALVAKLG